MPKCSLKDHTGSVEAMLSEELVEEFQSFLRIDNAVVLKNLQFMRANRSVRVVISKKNIVSFYSPLTSLSI